MYKSLQKIGLGLVLSFFSMTAGQAAEGPLNVALDGTFAPHAMPKMSGGVEGFNVDFEGCINNKEIEDFILNDRIDGVKKFKVNATPTIIINNEKFEKSLNYKNLKKAIEKLI